MLCTVLLYFQNFLVDPFYDAGLLFSTFMIVIQARDISMNSNDLNLSKEYARGGLQVLCDEGGEMCLI